MTVAVDWNGTPGGPAHSHACARAGSGRRPRIDDDQDREADPDATVTAPSAVVPLDHLRPEGAYTLDDLGARHFLTRCCAYSLLDAADEEL